MDMLNKLTTLFQQALETVSYKILYNFNLITVGG